MIFKYVSNAFYFRSSILVNRVSTYAEARDLLLHFAVVGQLFFPLRTTARRWLFVDGTCSCWYSSKYILCERIIRLVLFKIFNCAFHKLNLIYRKPSEETVITVQSSKNWWVLKFRYCLEYINLSF